MYMTATNLLLVQLYLSERDRAPTSGKRVYVVLVRRCRRRTSVLCVLSLMSD